MLSTVTEENHFPFSNLHEPLISNLGVFTTIHVDLEELTNSTML